jgi:hypothetical protein
MAEKPICTAMIRHGFVPGTDTPQAELRVAVAGDAPATYTITVEGDVTARHWAVALRIMASKLDGLQP